MGQAELAFVGRDAAAGHMALDRGELVGADSAAAVVVVVPVVHSCRTLAAHSCCHLKSWVVGDSRSAVDPSLRAGPAACTAAWPPTWCLLAPASHPSSQAEHRRRCWQKLHRAARCSQDLFRRACCARSDDLVAVDKPLSLLAAHPWQSADQSRVDSDCPNACFPGSAEPSQHNDVVQSGGDEWPRG